MSGHVITETYISNPIILQYLVFSDSVSRVDETEREFGVRSIPGSKGVVAVLDSSRPKQVSICSIYDCWD